MTENTYEVSLALEDGDFTMDYRAMGLLYGSGFQVVDTDDGPDVGELDHQRYRRRTSEAMAHTKSEDLISILRYWARKDHDADLVVHFVDREVITGDDE